MSVVSRNQFFAPFKLAYGEKEAGPFIKANSYLINEIELLTIQSAVNQLRLRNSVFQKVS